MSSKPMQAHIANQSLNSMPSSMKTVNMATIQPPPRKSKRTNEVTILRNKSSLETLMQMGFPKARAEKSLAATGDKGVQLASDWLLSHVNDPTLDVKVPREYVLYLCPVGTLQQQLLEFWHKSYIECGWNRAHNYFPHITLCSFFKADDSAATPLAHALKNVGERIATAPKYIGLEYFSSTNFIGLFVSENEAPFLKQVTADFAEEAKKLGVTVEPHKKQLHVSLAYQFPTEMKEKLESLAKFIQVNSMVRWDIRLYSRDAKKPNTQLWKVLYTYTPRAQDEIELIDGDFVYLDESEIESSPDGWFKGTSWLTGCTGMCPGSYAERTSESETWTLHRSIPITGAECNVPKVEGGSAESSPSHSRLQNGSAGSRVIANARNNQTCATAILRGTETLPARLPELTTIRNSEANGPITANNILYATVGDAPMPGVVNQSGTAVTGRDPGPHAVGAAHPAPPILQPLSSSSSTSATNNYNSQQKVAPGSHSPKMIRRNNTPSDVAVKSRSLDGHYSNSTIPEMINENNSHNTMKHSKSGESHYYTSTSTESLKSTSSGSSSCAYQALARPDFHVRPFKPLGPRQLYVIRHGERVDFTFGKDWIQQTFDKQGNYIRHDLNLPKTLPVRKGGPQDYKLDSPLTVQGHFQARIVGEALKEKDVPISHIYASPSFRCVETATSLLQGMELEREIRLEPGLFEWLGWYTMGLPKLMSPQDFKEFGFNVNLTHTPICPIAKFNMHETTEQYYERCGKVTQEILKTHEDDGGNVVFVAHAASLDVCTRQLVGMMPRNHAGFHDINHRIPYLAMAVVQEDVDIANKWSIIEPPVLGFAHSNNPKYNWSVLMTPSIM